ncbi:MAG: late competence development ComFB family protein [Treponemataceae bacterium]|nr:MAG: late competence development ComFB family protein [Treponemataceae bacterium]
MVHNIMEELVSKRVNELFEHVKDVKPLWFTCDCEDCRSDVITYVLNRIQPKYIVSGRGLNYNLSYSSSPQLNVDIDALGMEGLRNISATKRPYHLINTISREDTGMPAPVFNFPVIIGAVFDGRTFEPLSDVTITLKKNNTLAEMCDMSWTNPCITYGSTKGNFSFWVKPENADAVRESRTFSFSIEAKTEGFDPVSYVFDVNLQSESSLRKELNLVYSHKIPDFFLFPHGYMDDDD